MKINTVTPISFQYHSKLKDEWRSNPEMRDHVKFGIYGDRLTEQNLSYEHLKPHCEGGATNLKNGVLASKQNNNLRGNAPLKHFLTKEMFERYCDQFKGWTAKLFDNKSYIQGITETVEKQGINLKG